MQCLWPHHHLTPQLYGRTIISPMIWILNETLLASPWLPLAICYIYAIYFTAKNQSKLHNWPPVGLECILVFSIVFLRAFSFALSVVKQNLFVNKAVTSLRALSCILPSAWCCSNSLCHCSGPRRTCPCPHPWHHTLSGAVHANHLTMASRNINLDYRRRWMSVGVAARTVGAGTIPACLLAVPSSCLSVWH